MLQAEKVEMFTDSKQSKSLAKSLEKLPTLAEVDADIEAVNGELKQLKDLRKLIVKRQGGENAE